MSSALKMALEPVSSNASPPSVNSPEGRTHCMASRAAEYLKATAAARGLAWSWQGLDVVSQGRHDVSRRMGGAGE